MPRRLRRNRKREPLIEWQRHYLMTGEPPTADGDPSEWGAWLGWKYFEYGAAARKWVEHREELIAAHSAGKPWALAHLEA